MTPPSSSQRRDDLSRTSVYLFAVVVFDLEEVDLQAFLHLTHLLLSSRLLGTEAGDLQVEAAKFRAKHSGGFFLNRDAQSGGAPSRKRRKLHLQLG